MSSIMSSANSDSFTSFQFWNSFYFFSSLIAVARTSKTMLNKSGESGYHCLAPDLRENALSFPQLSMMLAVGLSYMAFIMLMYVCSLYARFLKSVYHKWVLNFVENFFSASIEMIIWFLLFILLM